MSSSVAGEMVSYLFKFTSFNDKVGVCNVEAGGSVTNIKLHLTVFLLLKVSIIFN